MFRFSLVLFILPLCHSFISHEFIKTINSNQSTWIAGRNFPEDTPVELLKRLAGTFLDPPTETRPTTRFFGTISDTFDARDFWPQCETIKEIRDQGFCGSCWAFGVATAMTDRLCIESNGTIIFKFSPEDLLTCCDECGSCSGGYTARALNFWSKSGVVSGGDYNSKEGCKPYSYTSQYGATPNCSTTCLNPNHTKTYEDDKKYGESYHQLSANVSEIQGEILRNGPVIAGYTVYTDFYSYKSGVYIRTTEEKIGGHAVKIIGWGAENGVPYWLVANSWGRDWGDRGFFKILRGENHCGIEERVHAGFPRL